MNVDRALKKEIMEMVHGAFASDPLAARKEVCERVIAEMENRPELMERAQDVSVFHMLETLTGEYVRRTRSRIRDAVKSGQADTGADGPPPYEAISKIRLTIPVGGGRYEDKPALMCDYADIRAARLYYSEQREAATNREEYCASLEQAMRDAELLPHQTVAELYAA